MRPLRRWIARALLSIANVLDHVAYWLSQERLEVRNDEITEADDEIERYL